MDRTIYYVPLGSIEMQQVFELEKIGGVVIQYEGIQRPVSSDELSAEKILKKLRKEERRKTIDEVRKFATEGLEANGGWLYCCEDLMKLLDKLEAGE